MPDLHCSEYSFSTLLNLWSFLMVELNFSSTILNTIKEGRIVPSEVTVKLIQREMESSDNHKFLIDGFPRSEENRIAFERIVSVSQIYIPFKQGKKYNCSPFIIIIRWTQLAMHFSFQFILLINGNIFTPTKKG